MGKSVTASIESVEYSIRKLTRCWLRRQKLKIIFSPREHNDIVNNDNGSSWRSCIIKFLDSTRVHYITIFLLLTDLVMTVLELISSLQKCAGQSVQEEQNLDWCHWVGIAILILLSTKTFALAISQGVSFFTHPGHVVDGIAFLVALFLEAFLKNKGSGLVVFVSLWRLVRLVENALELSDEAIEAQIESIKTQFQAIKDENSRLRQVISEKDEMIEKQKMVITTLQEELDKYRIVFR